MYLGSDLLDAADPRLDERLERVLLAATLILLASTGHIGEVGQLFARRQVLARHLVIVLRGSPHSSHRRGRRPCLIHLGRAVLVDISFEILEFYPQKSGSLDQSLDEPQFIFGHRSQKFPKPGLFRLDALFSRHLPLSRHKITAVSTPKFAANVKESQRGSHVRDPRVKWR